MYELLTPKQHIVETLFVESFCLMNTSSLVVIVHQYIQLTCFPETHLNTFCDGANVDSWEKLCENANETKLTQSTFKYWCLK